MKKMLAHHRKRPFVASRAWKAGLAAKSSQDVQLRYWLDAADLQDALTLEVDGKKLEVKSEKAYDLNGMTNGKEKVIDAGAW